MPRDFHPGSKPRAEVQPTRIFQRPASALTNTSADDLRHREHVPAARLDQRIAALRESIAAAERKRAGVDAAISSRKSALSRLVAQLLLERGAAPYPNE